MQGLESIVADLPRRGMARYLRAVSPEFRSARVITLQGPHASGFRETSAFPIISVISRQRYPLIVGLHLKQLHRTGAD